jgi:hypothetical protein
MGSRKAVLEVRNPAIAPEESIGWVRFIVEGEHLQQSTGHRIKEISPIHLPLCSYYAAGL